MLAYIETSILNAAWKAGWTGEQLHVRLALIGYRPATGHMLVHEIARPMAKGAPAATKALARLVSELHPTWQNPAPILLQQEVAFFRDHHPIHPGLDPANVAFTESELRQLASGHLNRDLRLMIDQRNADKQSSWPESTEFFRAEIEKLRTADQSRAPRFRVFTDATAFFASSMDVWVKAASLNQLSIYEARTVARQLQNYPALRTHAFSWMYLAFIVIGHGAQPSHDRLDDFRHALEAAYCQAFATNDRELARALRDLAPQLRPLSWEDIQSA